MERTSGSSAAWAKNWSTLASKLSYGWCTSRSPSAITLKMSPFGDVADLAAVMRAGVTGCHRGARSSGRGRLATCSATERSSIPSTTCTSLWLISSPTKSISSNALGISVPTSSRTTLPNRRWRSPSSIASRRSSASSSAVSRSASRVTRNRCASRISVPGKRRSRWAKISSSIKIQSPLPNCTIRPRIVGTFTRASEISWSSCARSRIASERLSELISGNGWPGSTARGVSTGKISRVNRSVRIDCSAASRSAHLRSGNPALRSSSTRVPQLSCADSVRRSVASRISASCTSGVRPSGPGARTPATC